MSEMVLNDAPSATTKPTTKKEKLRGGGPSKIDWVLAASLKTKGFDWPEIATQLNCNPNTLRSGMCRRGFTTVIQAAREGSAENEAEKLRAIIQGGIANELQQQVAALSSRPVKYGALANKRGGGQGRAAVNKTLAETYRAIYGGSDNVTISFGVSMLSDRSEPTAIDVQSSVVDTPTSSVPATSDEPPKDTMG